MATQKEKLADSIKAYCEGECIRLIVLTEPPDLESPHKLRPVERYIEALRRRTERACLRAKLRILPEMLDWAENEAFE